MNLKLMDKPYSEVKVVKLKLMDMLDLIQRCNFHPSAEKIQLDQDKTVSQVVSMLGI